MNMRGVVIGDSNGNERARLMGRGWWVLVLIAVATVGVAFLILKSDESAAWGIGRAAFDQDKFHLPTVHRFAREWPSPDVRDYASATTPGYHLVLAMVERVTGWGELELRVVGSVFACGLVGVLAWGIASVWRGRWWSGAALVLPLMVSSYVVQSAMYAVPDDAGWMFVCLTMLVGLKIASEGATRANLVLAAVSLVMLVMFRQIHVWAAACVWGGAAAPQIDNLLNGQMAKFGVGGLRARVGSVVRGLMEIVTSRAVVWAVVATVPAFVVVGWFVWVWGGLAPPGFRAATNPLAVSGAVDATTVTGISPSTPALVLALAGVFGVFVLGYFRREVLEVVRGGAARRSAVIGGCVAGAIALVGPTVWASPGRKGALWDITRKFEGTAGMDRLMGMKMPRLVVGETNLVMWSLAVLGGVVLGILWRGVDRRSRWVLAVGLIGFTAATSAQALSWQRYIEPMMLIWLALCAASVTRRGEEGEADDAWWVGVGPWALAVGLGAVTWGQLGGG